MLTAVAVLLAALALGSLALLASAGLGCEPAWLARARHALGEARHRAGGVLLEFGDWLRLGR